MAVVAAARGNARKTPLGNQRRSPPVNGGLSLTVGDGAVSSGGSPVNWVRGFAACGVPGCRSTCLCEAAGGCTVDVCCMGSGGTLCVVRVFWFLWNFVCGLPPSLSASRLAVPAL